jgi:23S rRNA (cytidine1920-2'-O)/16S rRNA (cytidine1409-2'-O)-methyltransferase
MVEDTDEPIVLERQRYVSRGGDKLANALDRLEIDPEGLDCIDVGASTGGFTDCLLERGATRVIAVDVAHGQLDDRLRRDPRVTEIARRNARDLSPTELPYVPHLATLDLSFISLTKVIPAIAECLAPDCLLLAMVKPQFELERKQVKGGVVRDEALRRTAVTKVAEHLLGLGFDVRGFAYSGLPGPKGNRETFIWATRGEPRLPANSPAPLDSEEAIAAILAETEL